MTSRITRRRFLERVSGGAVPLFAASRLHPWAGDLQRSGRGAGELSADLVIVGGGFGGCAAALAAARSGLRVVMTEETDWIGGQLTAQAVPLDENAWIDERIPERVRNVPKMVRLKATMIRDKFQTLSMRLRS